MKLAVALLAAIVGVTSAQSYFSPIAEKGIYGTLLDTIAFAELKAVIAENAPVTIIGPSDQAFGEVAGIIATLDTDQIIEIILDHIIPNATITSDVLRKEGCMVVETMGGLELSLFRDPISSEMDADNDLIVDRDVLGDYGVLHGIEDVIISAQHQHLGCPSLSDISAISDRDDYSTLLSLIEQTHNHFTITMNTENTTIFGPTNAAFAAAQNQLSLLSEDLLYDVIRGHMAFGEILSEEVITFGCVEMSTIAGTQLAIRFDETSGKASVNGVPISSTDFDIRGEFFILHGIEGTLFGSQYVPCSVDTLDFSPAVSTGNYNTFLDLVAQTGLDDIISVNRTTTILAPTDAAIARLQSNLPGLSDAELASALPNHVISGIIVDSAAVRAEECIDALTVGGDLVNINFDITTGKITANGIPVVQANITGNFGILHGIDGVLGLEGEYLPCSPYSEIESFAEFYEVDVNAAADSEPVTIFGPRNDAIYTLDTYPFESPGSRQKEIDFLLGHSVPGVYTVDEVKDVGCVVLETLTGGKVRVMWVEEGHGQGGRRRRLSSHSGVGVVMVNDAKVIFADQSNGDNILHGIDKVILPGTFSECPMSMPTMAPATAPIQVGNPTAPTPTSAQAESSAFSSDLGVLFASMISLVALS